MRSVSSFFVALLLVGCGASLSRVASPGSLLSHGIAAGDVASTRAVVWGRCADPSSFHVKLNAAGGSLAAEQATNAEASHDMVGKIAFENLRQGERYDYRAWCGDDEARGLTGTFSTAPPSDAAAPVDFVWGGDLGGQNACRHASRGYPIFDTITALKPDFFIALGDLIYADDPCKLTGRYGNEQIPGPPAPALTREMFWDIWKYNRTDPAYQRLLAATPVYPVWDDHEIMNDAGPQQDTLPIAPQTHLLQPALQAYIDYQPMLPPTQTPTRLYSSVRWGKHVEMFILDQRQYRDANRTPDSVRHPKTMLGAEQRQWLLDGLRRSDATWKVIVSSVPLSVPTGSKDSGHDGWTGFGAGDGFERERAMIFEAMRGSKTRNFVWITTDAHFGAVFRYHPFRYDKTFTFDELISGPLTAGIFPQDDYDRSIGTERLFKYAPQNTDAIADFDEAMTWFNFGTIEVNESGELTSKLINGQGKVVYEATRAPR